MQPESDRIMTDQETSAAVEALAHRLRNRDAAMNDGGDYPDAEPFALEFMTALRGRGWRHTEAKAKPDPHADGGRNARAAEVTELVARVRAEREAKAAEARAAKEAGAA